MFAVIAALVSPRTIPFSCPFLVAGALLVTKQRGSWTESLPAAGSDMLMVAIFFSYAMLSVLWAADPSVTIMPVLSAIAYVVAMAFFSKVLFNEPRRNLYHIGEGYWIGLLVGLVYLLIEISTHQAIKIFVYNLIGLQPGALRPPSFFKWSGNRVIAISPLDLTRNISPITPLLWPALLVIRGTAAEPFGKILRSVLLVLAVAVIGLSEHETSKVALVVGAGVFLVTQWNCRRGVQLLRLAWVLACVTPIPVSIALYRLDLHNAKWLQGSARERIVIWNYTAEVALNSPIIGAGANTMYVLSGKDVPKSASSKPAKWSPHAHNAYLETWFELGAIGVIILMLLGLSIIDKFQKLKDRVVPYAAATFASAATVGAASYGMWQIWFIAMFAMSFGFFTLAVRCNEKAD